MRKVTLYLLNPVLIKPSGRSVTFIPLLFAVDSLSNHDIPPAIVPSLSPSLCVGSFAYNSVSARGFLSTLEKHGLYTSATLFLLCKNDRVCFINKFHADDDTGSRWFFHQVNLLPFSKSTAWWVRVGMKIIRDIQSVRFPSPSLYNPSISASSSKMNVNKAG